jgi:rubrerythrin
MFVLPSMIATGVAWRLDVLARRRDRLNLCPRCNYDRAGIGKDAVCPECGAPPV